MIDVIPSKIEIVFDCPNLPWPVLREVKNPIYPTTDEGVSVVVLCGCGEHHNVVLHKGI